MKRGESRFFIYWQLNEVEAKVLHEAKTDKERTAFLGKWITRKYSGLLSVVDIEE